LLERYPKTLTSPAIRRIARARKFEARTSPHATCAGDGSPPPQAFHKNAHKNEPGF
jgi:hypothetical protein